MVRASETYGYPSGKAMQHRKSERHPKGWPLEKVCVAGFSAHALWDEIPINMSDPFTSKGIPGWIAFSCKDGHHVSSGETIIKCAQMIDKVHPITGIGINCSKPEYVESLIKDIRTVTDKPIAVYPNLGESYDSKTKTWYGDAASFVDYVEVWRKAGAEIIGGCCRTTPEIIGDIAKKIHN